MGRKGDGVELREKSIRISFSYEGKRERHTLMIDEEPMAPTPANVKYARRLAAEVRDKIRHGTFSIAEYFPKSAAASVGTVGAHLDLWLSAQRIETSTREGYSSAIKFWKASVCDKRGRVMAGMALPILKHSHILTAIASRPDLSGKTINNYVSVLRDALSLAVKDKLISDNPAADIPRAKYQKDPPDPFTAAEREAIIAEMGKRYPGEVHNLVEFWFWTGVRTSELFGLRWPNVDLASGAFQVSEAVVRGERKDRTKTSVTRLVRLNSRSLDAIQRQRAHTHIAGEEVFRDPRYRTAWVDERAFRRSFWTPTLKRLGIRYRRPYNMRHTYATAMLMAGMTPAFCAKQLGNSVEMFLRTYAKWVDGSQNDAEMARLESTILPGNFPGKLASTLN
ncbi:MULTISPECIES: site-specific integrase [unclassified Achromobacter]|uniref:site-specific integrase n=1 Tax=unclassified Achromobacter TaxID=2626865 RepID=UPI000B51A650|nr:MULTISPECIES: site-specific integrase [unclassified Achromobacter]OWT68818.1 integrase [Achromobacter sp. HZ28]OWT78619.1 integrase [Achromobacter sp. HZ34]